MNAMSPRDDPPEPDALVDDGETAPMPVRADERIAEWDAWRIKARDP